MDGPRRVACRVCNALIGEECESPNTRDPLSGFHSKRVKDAERFSREAKTAPPPNKDRDYGRRNY